MRVRVSASLRNSRSAWLQAGLALALGIVLFACTQGADQQTGSPSTSTLAAGNETTTTSASAAQTSSTTLTDLEADLPVVFSEPIDGLTPEELERFNRGAEFFDEVWTQRGPTETDSDGLGPLFNANSCASCHLNTGRRRVPPDGELVEPGLVIRIGIPGRDAVTGAALSEPVYGDQLQDRALSGDAEGTAFTQYVTQFGTYPDGTQFELLWPTVNIRDRGFGPLQDLFQVSARIGPQMIGMGGLEAISIDDILAQADPSDSNGDGISGRMNLVWNPITETREYGRFGWKSNLATLELQSAQAFHGDMGITSTIFPFENCTESQTICDETPNGGTAEVSDEKLADIVFYLRALAVPDRAEDLSDDVVEGEQLFTEVGCSSCHTPSYTTVADAAIPSMRSIEIRPYTDMLLHDLGFDMADDRPDFEANGNEWRTPPLWGLGSIPVEGDRGLLHDGRARTLEEAILWHGGEGSFVRNNYMSLSAEQRDKVLAFLESL